MKDERRYDIRLLFATLSLVALGVIMVTSASETVVDDGFRSPLIFMQKQVVRVSLGILALLIFMRVKYTLLRRWSAVIAGFSIILLLLVLIYGIKVRGARRWLSIFNFTLQPVEMAKLSLVIFLAAKLAGWKGRVKDFKHGVLPLLGVAVSMAVLVALQPNISNVVFIIAITFLMLFIGGCRLIHLFPLSAALALFLMPVFFIFPHVQQRIIAFINRGECLAGVNWHVEQSLIALGSGFIFGFGPGRGNQKFSFLPDSHTDFIYSIMGEELGIIGTLLVLSLFVMIIRRSLKIAREAPDNFGYLLSLGIGCFIFITAMLNISVTLGLIPIAGLPLPFVSYGGSALVTSMAGVGILLNISLHGEKKRKVRSAVERKKARGIYARPGKRGRGK